MKQKFLTGLTISILLGACSSSHISNLNEENNSGDKIKFITSYNSKDLQTFITKQFICKTGTDIEACNKNKANLAEQFNFNLDQVGKNNPITKINAYDVVYQSPGVDGEERTLSGGILVPDTTKENIKGIMIFYHPTVVTKNDVPSCFLYAKNLPEYCHSSNTNHGSIFAEDVGGIFATQGYIVVMPDYIGQGIDSSMMHPYIIHPQVNALSGLNMLAASRDILKGMGIDEINSLNLYLTGYSEGGSYSLWASKLLQSSKKHFLSENNLSLSLAAPISGAYNLSGAQIPLEFANVTAYPHADKFRALDPEQLTDLKPVVTTYYLTSLAYYHYQQKYSEVFSSDFINCDGYCNFNGEKYSIPALYTTVSPNLTINNISSGATGAARDSINPNNNLAYAADNNSISSFTAEGLIQNKTFNKITRQADIVSWQTTKPVTFIHLDYDSVVTPLNTETAYNGLRKRSNKNLVNSINISNFDYMTSIGRKDSDDLQPLDHMGCRIFLFIAALNEFNKQAS